MLRSLHQLSFRLSTLLFVLLLLPLAARADSLQPIADQAAQYLSDIQGQYGSKDDPGARSTRFGRGQEGAGRRRCERGGHGL